MSEQSQYYYFSISEAKVRIARTYYLNLIYFCRKYAIFTRFYESMLQKVLKFANYAVAVLVLKIMLSCSNYAKNYASTIRQCLLATACMFVHICGLKKIQAKILLLESLLSYLCKLLWQLDWIGLLPLLFLKLLGQRLTVTQP